MTDPRSALEITQASIRTPRAAAYAGIAFSLLLSAVIVLIHRTIPPAPGDAGDWLTNNSKRNTAVAALNLVPFAGIAFLWFVGAVRDRIGDREDRFFASVFLGSGLLLIAMFFAAGASASGLVLSAGRHPGFSPEMWTFGRQMTYTLLIIYAMRMAAVFALSTTAIVARLELVRPWLVALGIATGAVLLIGPGLVPWIELIFPAWVFILSVDILVVTIRSPKAVTDQ